MNELNIKNFKYFNIEDKDKLYPILSRLNYKLSDYSFTNLFIWSEQFGLKWSFYKDKIFIVYDSSRDYCTMLIDIDSYEYSDVSIYLKISDEMIRQGRSGNFYLVDLDFVDKNKEKFSHYFETSVDESFSDYVYNTKMLVDLKGPKLAKKKNLISQFQRNYPNYFVKTICKEDLVKCIELAEKWCKVASKCNDLSFIQEELALKKAILYYNELNLDGLLLYSSSNKQDTDSMCAFTLFSKLNDNTADIHFEKSDIQIHGSAQVINWETAKYLANKYAHLNREQDLGVQGLRQAKKSYVPEFIYHSYILKRK